MFAKMWSWLFLLGVYVVLAGCVSAPSHKTSETIAGPQRHNPVPLLLRQAEMYLARDRLMSPASGNAYDRFQAVLMISPDHPQAVSGLQQILIRYLELGRAALRKNDTALARRMLASAARIDANNLLLQEFQQELDRALASAGRAQSGVANHAEFVLDGNDLAARNSALRQVLASVAQRLRGTDKSVLIVARNDAEGRWLYKALREAASGQRIRGDIKIDSVPRVVLLPPID